MNRATYDVPGTPKTIVAANPRALRKTVRTLVLNNRCVSFGALSSPRWLIDAPCKGHLLAAKRDLFTPHS